MTDLRDVREWPGWLEFPTSFEDQLGVVHTGERCIRLDGQSDWPWMDCYANSAFMQWVPKPVTCLWCISRTERPEELRGPWPPKRDSWI